MQCSNRPRPRARLLITLLGVLAASSAQMRAGDSLFDLLFAHDVRVVTVTDFTDEGRKLPLVSTASPVYYMLYDFGFTTYGRTWAGEKLPKTPVIRQMIITALASQGYLVADATHPPTQTLALTWGTMGGSHSMAVPFLGGEKLDLMSGVVKPGFMLSQLDLRVLEFSERDLFVAIVRSYDPESLKEPKIRIYWETRFASPSTGQSLAKALPLMVKAAAASLGVETPKPISVNATREFQGNVELGELKTIEMTEPEPAPRRNDEKKTPPAAPESR